ncbi:hypothetical protein NHJ13734_002998 [Beauveria thailandica]
MQRSTVVYDGLWRCLCPAFDRTLVRHAARLPAFARAASTWTAGRRDANTTTEAPTSIDTFIQDMLRTGPASGPTTRAPRPSMILTSKTPPDEPTLFAMSIDELTDHLHTLRGREKPWMARASPVNRHNRIVHIVRHLVVRRQQRLTAFLYECIVDTLSDPECSGVALVALMRDMAQQNIEATREFYSVALESLAVHPSYVAMLEILEQTRARDWPEDRQTLALVLLRDEQYELAYDTLMELHAGNTRVAPWIYDMFVFVFGKMGFVDEMMEVLTARLSLASTDGLDALQYYALDVCSAAFHYPGTLAGWNTLVRSGKVHVADGMVENVLNTAARQADTTLASEALDMLAQRTRLQDYHYDSLIDAFILDNDLASATRLHCIMHTISMPVTEAAVQRLLVAAGQRGRELNEWLLAASAQKLEAPPRLVHAAMTRHVLDGDAELALELYSRYEQLCGEAWPPVEVMLLLLPHCGGGGGGGKAATAAALRDRLLEELRAQEPGEARDSMAARLAAAADKMLRDGKTAEGMLLKEKLDETMERPQIEQS